MKELWEKFNQLCDWLSRIILVLIALIFLAYFSISLKKNIIKDAIRELQRENNSGFSNMYPYKNIK